MRCICRKRWHIVDSYSSVCLQMPSCASLRQPSRTMMVRRRPAAAVAATPPRRSCTCRPLSKQPWSTPSCRPPNSSRCVQPGSVARLLAVALENSLDVIGNFQEAPGAVAAWPSLEQMQHTTCVLQQICWLSAASALGRQRRRRPARCMPHHAKPRPLPAHFLKFSTTNPTYCVLFRRHRKRRCPSRCTPRRLRRASRAIRRWPAALATMASWCCPGRR